MPAGPPLAGSVPNIEVAGKFNALLQNSLTRLVVDERLDQPTTCEATFVSVGPLDDGSVGYTLFDPALLDFGAEVSVTRGRGGSAGTLFAGRVTGLRAEYPAKVSPQLVILAEDSLHMLRTTRRTVTFQHLKDAEIIEQMAGQHGLDTQMSLDGPVREVVVQLNQTDLDFVRGLLRPADAELWVDGTTLWVTPRAHRRSGRPTILTLGQNLRDARLTADLSGEATSLSVTGWDESTKAAIDVATDKVPDRERGNGRTGPEVLAESFGARTDQLVHTGPASATEAQSLADAEFRRRARRFVTGQATIDGNTQVRVGARVSLVGLGSWYSGTYDVVGVQHRFDHEEGFRSVVSVERGELER